MRDVVEAGEDAGELIGWKYVADLVIATPSLDVTAPMLAATIDGSSVAVACVPRRSGSAMSPP